MEIIKALSFHEDIRGPVKDQVYIAEYDAWHPVEHPQYYEWWYFDAHFDNGYATAVMFSTRDISKMHKETGPRVLVNITTPEKNYQRAEYLTMEEFTASKTECDVKIGKSYCKGDFHEYKIYGAAKGLEVDLTFRCLERGWMPGTGQIDLGNSAEDYFYWNVPVPQAEVTGKLIIDGKAIQVKGRGYHDHNAGNISMNDVMSHWYWGRISFDDVTCIFADIFCHPRYGFKKVMPFYLARDGEKLIGRNGFDFIAGDFVTEPTLNVSYPKLLKLSVKDSPVKVEGEIRLEKVMTVDDMLPAIKDGDEEKVKQQAEYLKKFIRPSYLRFKGAVDLRIDGQSYKGETVYELMTLNQPINV